MTSSCSTTPSISQAASADLKADSPGSWKTSLEKKHWWRDRFHLWGQEDAKQSGVCHNLFLEKRASHPLLCGIPQRLKLGHRTAFWATLPQVGWHAQITDAIHFWKSVWNTAEDFASQLHCQAEAWWFNHLRRWKQIHLNPGEDEVTYRCT